MQSFLLQARWKGLWDLDKETYHLVAEGNTNKHMDMNGNTSNQFLHDAEVIKAIYEEVSNER